MSRLTENRLASASEILERYRAELFARRTYQTGLLERGLRDLWGVGYQSLKGVMIDLTANARYREVAAYYMEYSNGPGPVMEFQSTLAALYGLDRYYANELDERRKAYWDGVLGQGGA